MKISWARPPEATNSAWLAGVSRNSPYTPCPSVPLTQPSGTLKVNAGSTDRVEPLPAGRIPAPLLSAVYHDGNTALATLADGELEGVGDAELEDGEAAREGDAGGAAGPALD